MVKPQLNPYRVFLSSTIHDSKPLFGRGIGIPLKRTLRLPDSLHLDFLHPAVIAVVRQGADVEFRCTSKDAPNTDVLHAYLCKNHRITDVNLWDSVRKHAYFLIRRVQVEDSSNYSCVLSQRLLATTDLDMCGSNTVSLKVNGENYNVDIAGFFNKKLLF